MFCPFSRVLSFSYLIGLGISVTSTLSFVATFTTVSVASFTSGVPTRCITSPVFGFTSYVVVTFLVPFSPRIVIFFCPFSLVLSFSYLTGLGISVTSTLSFAATFTTVSVASFTSRVPTRCVTSPVFGFTSYVVVTFLVPFSPRIVIFFCPFSLVLSFSYLTGLGISVTSALSFAATFTTVSVASFTSGVPTRCVTSPVFGFTSYVVVTFLVPFCPSTVILSCPTSLVLSFSYLTGLGISITSTLSFAATFTTVSVASLTSGFSTFSVTSPVFGFTSYVVVTFLVPFCPGIVILFCPFSRVLSFSYLIGLDISVTSTLSFAATFTTVSVASLTSGFSTFSVTSPVFGFTSYVVVTFLVPFCPRIVIFFCPFSRVLSFSYLTGLGISVTSTLSFAGTFIIVSVAFFSVFSTVSLIVPSFSLSVYFITSFS